MRATIVTLGILGNGVEHLGWSEDGAAGPHLIIMRDLSSSDGYCLVTSGGTYYGGVVSMTIEPDESHFLLSTEAAEALGVGTSLVIHYPPGAVDGADLRTMIDRLIS